MADERNPRTPERQMQVAERFQRRRESALSRPAQSLGEAISRVPSQMGRNIADRVSQEFGTLGSATVAAIRTPGARYQAFKREVSQGIRGAIADALGSGQIGRYLADKVRGGIRYDKDPQKNFERLRAGLVAASQDFQQIKGTISSVNKQTRELALVVKQVAEKVNRIEREQSIQQRLIDQLKQAADENKPRVSGLSVASNDNNKVSPAGIAPQIDSLLSGAIGGTLSRIPFSRFAKFGAWGLAAYAGYKAAQLFDQAAKNAPKETEKQIRQAEEDLKSGDPKRQTKALGDLARARSLPQNSQTDKANADAIKAGVSVAKTPEEAAITGLVADYQRATTTQEKEVVLSQLSAYDYKTVQSVVSRFQVLGLMNDLDRYNGNKKRNLRKQQKSLDQYPDESIRRSRWKDRSLEELGITKQGNVTTIASNTVEVKAGPNTIILNSENTRTTGNLTIKGDLIIEGEVKVKGQPDWAQKAFNPDDNSPNAPRSIRQRRYTRGRAGAIQAPGVFGKASSVTLAERYARMGTNMEKQQFLAYGQLPRGFENVPGHMGILGSPGAVMARGAMPLGQFGGGGTVGGYGGMPSVTGGGGGYIGGSGGYSGGSNQSYPVNSTANVSRTLSSTTPSVQLNDQRQVAAPSVQPQPTKQSSDNTLVGDKTNPLAQQRLGRGGAQLSQSEKLHFYALAMAEMGDVNSLTKRGIDPTRAYAALMETAYNRGMTEPSKRGKNIMSSLQKDYYEPLRPWRPGFRNYNNFLNQLKQNPKLFEQLDRAHNMVIGGSNYSNYGTQNASAGVAAEARRTQSVTSTEFGETLSRKDKPEYAQLHGAGTIRETKKWYEQTKTAVQQWQQQQKQPQPLSTGFVGGLFHRKTDESQKTQAERFATSVGGNAKTFAHSDKSEDIVNWAKNNPNSPVVLYSAGAKHLNTLLAEGIDPKRITLAEPYNPNAKQMKDFLSKGGKLVYNPGTPGRGYFKGVENLQGAIVNNGSHKQSYAMAGEKILSQAQSTPPAQPTNVMQPPVTATPETRQPAASMPIGDTRFAFPMPGAATADATISGKVIQTQQQVAATRKRPISDKLNKVLQYAADQSGVEVEIYSGGQRGINEPHGHKHNGRTGSTRHDYGNAADLKLYVNENGKRRLLDARNSADRTIMQNFIRASAAAGATGIGHGGGYMGHSSLHVGFGSVATWGGGMGHTGFNAAFYEGRKNQIDLSAYTPSQQTKKDESAIVPISKMDIANQIKADGQPAATSQAVAKPENIAPSINLPNLMPGMAAGQAFTQLPTTEGMPSPAATSQVAGAQALPEEDSRKSMFAETPSVAGIPSPANIAQAAGAQALQPELPPMPVMPQGLPSGAEGVNAPPSITGLPAEPTGLPMTAGIPGGPVAGETVPGAETAPPVSAQASTAASAGSDGSGGGGGSGGAPGFRNHPESQAASPGSQGLGSFGRCWL